MASLSAPLRGRRGSDSQEQVHQGYNDLNSPGLAEAEPVARACIASIQGCQKNRYESNGQVIDKVNRR